MNADGLNVDLRHRGLGWRPSATSSGWCRRGRRVPRALINSTKIRNSQAARAAAVADQVVAGREDGAGNIRSDRCVITGNDIISEIALRYRIGAVVATAIGRVVSDDGIVNQDGWAATAFVIDGPASVGCGVVSEGWNRSMARVPAVS